MLVVVVVVVVDGVGYVVDVVDGPAAMIWRPNATEYPIHEALEYLYPHGEAVVHEYCSTNPWVVV